MDIIINVTGTAHCIYSEEFDLAALGTVEIRRASHVEPGDGGRWWADLSPVQGPLLGPFALRSDALAAEIAWLGRHVISVC